MSLALIGYLKLRLGMLLGDPDFNSHQVLHHLVRDKGNGDGGHDLHRKGDRSHTNRGRPNVAGSLGALIIRTSTKTIESHQTTNTKRRCWTSQGYHPGGGKSLKIESRK